MIMEEKKHVSSKRRRTCEVVGIDELNLCLLPGDFGNAAFADFGDEKPGHRGLFFVEA